MLIAAKHKQKSLEKEQARAIKQSQNVEDLIAPVDEQVIQFVEEKTFAELGVCPEICSAVEKMGYKFPSKIQAESLPYSLKGRDIIGKAETGSGKTAAFAIPIIQTLLESPQPYFACVMSPTRELCVQIAQQFEALGALIGLRTAVLVGGLDMVSQAIALSKKPHVIVGTPGRLADHLANTKGFNLKRLRYLVFDEADRLLSMDFEKQINLILTQIPKQRNTFLFSATMTDKVQKLQRASLHDPVLVEVMTKYKTVETLEQNILFIQAKYKETYLVYLLTQLSGKKTIIFTSTCNLTQKLVLTLKFLNFKAVNIHGKMSQQMRLDSLNKFKTGERSILLATDVASRGLDIPCVDCVINFDIPGNSKDYLHRVGRTARAGRTGRAISLISQYDIEILLDIEKNIGIKLEPYKVEEKHALLLNDSVIEAMRQATIEMKDSKYLKDDNDENEAGDNAEADQDKDMFKKKTYKNSGKLSHNKGFKSGSSFARKRQRVK